MLSAFATSYLVKYPSTAAESLENVDVQALAAVAVALEPVEVARLFAHMLPHRVAAALTLLSPDLAAGILDHLEFSQTIRLMYQLEPTARSAIIARMHPASGQSLARALDFPPATVGRLMISRVGVFRPRDAVERAIDELKLAHDPLPLCFVVDERERSLGVVKVADLIRTPAARTMGELMTASAAAVSALARLENIREAVLADGPDYLPVVDPDQRLIGVLSKVEWAREMERGVDPVESPELVSLWLGVANLFWQVGARMVANSTNAPPPETELSP